MSVAIAMAALSVGSSLLGSSDDGAWKGQAAKAGRNTAALDAARGRALSLLPGRARQIEEASLMAKVEADSNEAAAVSEATVQAAAAGVAGASVDQSIAQHQSNASTVRAAIEKQRQAGALQLSQDHEDIFWESENQRYGVEVNTQSNASRILSAGLSGATSYLSARP